MIARCSYVSPFGSGQRCWHRGIFGYCVHHWLDKARWEWAFSHFYVSIDLSNLNLPRINIDEERPIEYVALSYGSDGCDPVAMVGWRKRKAAK